MYTFIFIPTSIYGSSFQCLCDDNIDFENMKDELLIIVVLFDTVIRSTYMYSCVFEAMFLVCVS